MCPTARHDRLHRLLGGLLAAALAGACSQEPPQLLTLRDHELAANDTLSFDVAATDADTDKLTFSFRPEVKGAELVQIEGKLAKFTWSPNPAQAGVTTLTFAVTDGVSQDTETINVKVTSDGVPELVSPDRYVFDPSTTEVRFTLAWKAAEASELDFSFDPDPTAWGAELDVQSKEVGFAWTPTAEQKRTTQHLFSMRATDPEGHTASRTITIVFRAAGGGANCDPSLALPVVTAEAIADQAGDQAYPVSATVTDADSPIQAAVVFYTDVEAPVESDWQQAPLAEDAGTPGRYTGSIPNVRPAAGTTKTVRYQVCALDDDDPNGDACDGWACSTLATFAATAAAAAGGMCDSCATAACGSGFNCRTIRRITGQNTKQCLPTSCTTTSTDPGCTCGELVINEVLADVPLACPDGMVTCDAPAKLSVDVNGDGARKKDEGDEEFVEIVNVSATKKLDLRDVGIYVDLQLKFRFPAFELLPGWAVVVFGGGDAANYPARANVVPFSSTGSGQKTLSLLNSRGTVVIGTPVRKLDTVTWSSQASERSIVRQPEARADSPMVDHKTATGTRGPYSPGTRTDGSPFTSP
jgi:hypothetical protein